MGFHFSKSKFVSACTRCNKYAWLDNYKPEEKAPVEKVIKEEVKEETPAQPKGNNGWGKFWKSLTTDNVFKDNDA